MAIILSVSGGYQTQTMELFPVYHFGADFDHGKMRPVERPSQTEEHEHMYGHGVKSPYPQ